MHHSFIHSLFIRTCKPHIVYDYIFYIPNPTQYLNLTTTLLTINMLRIKFIEAKVVVNVYFLILRIGP